MAKQIYYQNLPIPSNIDNIPTYLNNELQILGTVISDINDNIGQTAVTVNSIDNTIILKRIDQTEADISSLTLNQNRIDADLIDLKLSNEQSNQTIDDLQSYVTGFNNDIANDNVISQSEKSKLFQDWKTIYTEYPKILDDAAKYPKVSTTNYITAFASLKNYLISDPIYIPSQPVDGTEFCANPKPFAIDGKTFRNKFVEYYFQKTTILNSFSGAAKSAADDVSYQVSGAYATAAQASADAATAMSMISAATTDNAISQGEKPSIFIEWKKIYDEKTGITAQGTNSGVSTTNYDAAYTTLATYLTSSPISIQNPPTDGAAWCSDINTIIIVGTTFRNNFASYYYERQLLLNAVSSNYLTRITDIASDNIISQSEKPDVFIRWKEIYDEKSGIITQGTNASVSTTNYNTAYTTLATYLTSTPISIQTPPTDGATWCADATAITIVGTTFRTNFANYYNEKQLLLNAVSTAIKTTSDTASSNASTAVSNAATALNGLNDILSDGKITQDEKPTVFMDWKAIYDEKPDIVTKATSYSVSTTNYTTAYTTLATYLTSTPISIDATPTTGATWCANTSAITITGTTFRSNFTTYYNERQLVLNAIAAAAKVLADNAQSTANTASTNASNAVSTANTASTNATTALNGLNDILNDGKITQDEKPTIFMDWKAIYDEKPDIVTKATSYSVATTNYTTAYTTLATYLTSAPISIDATPTTGATWCASSTVITITGTTFRSNFNSYYNERQLVLNAISAAAKVLADNAQSTANTASSNASTALSTANTANTNAADRLSKSAANTLSGSCGLSVGSLTWNSSGVRTGGYGLGFTSNGIAAYNSAGTPTFTIDTSGSAIFAGTITVSGTNYATSSFLNSNVTATSVGLGNVSNLTPQNQTQTGLIAGTTITGGGITMSAGGAINGGKTSFSDTTNAGFIIGYGAGASANQYGFKFGNAGMTQGIYWDGSTLTIKGDLTGSTGMIANSLTVGTTPAISGTTMTGSGAVFNSGGTFAIGNSTTNLTFNGTTITMNGAIVAASGNIGTGAVANTNLGTNAVTAVKVGASEITTLFKSQVSPQYTVVSPNLNTWVAIDSLTFTVPTIGDGTTTVDVLIEIVGSVYDKSTTSNSRTQIGTYIQRVSTGAYLREAIYSMWMNSANGTVASTLPGSGTANPLGATTDVTFTDKWVNAGFGSVSLTQGAQYIVGLKYFVATGSINVIDHFTTVITVLKR